MAYRIKTVADMLGMPRNTLIAWERRLGIVDPHRTASGYRLYSDEDVALLRRLKELVDQGLKVGEAWSIVQVERTWHGDRTAPGGGAPPQAENVIQWTRLVEPLLDFDGRRADELAEGMAALPVDQQLDEILYPLLHEVGQGWGAGNISVAQEHFVSGWCRERMMRLLQALPPVDEHAPEVICATPAGEHHELGLLGLAIRLVSRRFRVTWLGANVPTSELVSLAESRKPFAICLSLVQERSPAEVGAYARELRRRIRPSTRIALGGRGASPAEIGAVSGVMLCGNQLPTWAVAEDLRGAGGAR